MNLKSMISRLPVVGQAVAKSLGWQNTMFGDLLGGGSGSTTGDLTRPYAKSVWVRSAISFVAGPIAMRPLLITADRRGGDVPVEEPR